LLLHLNVFEVRINPSATETYQVTRGSENAVTLVHRAG
jgi:hypothetical protein